MATRRFRSARQQERPDVAEPCGEVVVEVEEDEEGEGTEKYKVPPCNDPTKYCGFCCQLAPPSQLLTCCQCGNSGAVLAAVPLSACLLAGGRHASLPPCLFFYLSTCLLPACLRAPLLASLPAYPRPPALPICPPARPPTSLLACVLPIVQWL